MNNKLKVLITLVLIVCLVGAISFYSYMVSNSTANMVQETHQSINNVDKEEEVKQRIQAMYYDDKRDFLAEGLKASTIKETKKMVDEMNASTTVKNKHYDALDDLDQRFKAQEAVNKLFADGFKAIDGNKVNMDLAFANDLKLETVQEVKAEYYFEEKDEETSESSFQDESIVEESVDESPEKLDAFHLAINSIIDKALISLDSSSKVKDAFEAVKKIKIEDGNIGKIAQAMSVFEKEMAMIETKSPDIYKELDEEAKKYTDRFIKEVAKIGQEIPDYYDIVVIAVEPSKRLSKAVKDNQKLFETNSSDNRTTTQHIDREDLDTTGHTNDYYYEDQPLPVVTTEDWEVTTNPPETSEPVETTAHEESNSDPSPNPGNPNPGEESITNPFIDPNSNVIDIS